MDEELALDTQIGQSCNSDIDKMICSRNGQFVLECNLNNIWAVNQKCARPKCCTTVPDSDPVCGCAQKMSTRSEPTRDPLPPPEIKCDDCTFHYQYCLNVCRTES